MWRWQWGGGGGGGGRGFFARKEMPDIGEGREGLEGRGGVLDAKERREVEDRSSEEVNENKDDDDKDEGGGLTRTLLDYYDEFSNLELLERP